VETTSLETTSLETKSLPAASDRFIVKVTPTSTGYLATTQPDDALAVGNGYQSNWNLEKTPKIQKRMGDLRAQFFFAVEKNDKLNLLKFAPWQDW